MRSQVIKTTSACFAVLRQLRGIRCSVPGTVFQSLSHWCRVWCYRSWTTAMQCWLTFYYTLHGACNRWWTPPHGSSSRHQSAITSRRSYANYTGWKFHGGYITSWPFWFTNVLMACHRHTSLTNFIVQHAESEFRRRLQFASSHELSVSRTRLSTYGDQAFPVAAVRIWNSLPQHINLLRHFPSSAFAWRHTSSNSVTGNYCCHAREVTLSFMDTLIALIYLLTSGGELL